MRDRYTLISQANLGKIFSVGKDFIYFLLT